MTGVYDYDALVYQLQAIITREIPRSNIILLEYYFKDDLCRAPHLGNNWNRKDMAERKKFTNSMRKKMQRNNITYIALFEPGMTLENTENDPKAYYFMDSANFFRKHLFVSPTNCGSYALIKPNGETLIRNGEYRPDWMAAHLDARNWALFFEVD